MRRLVQQGGDEPDALRDDLAQMLVHDMRSFLMGVTGYLTLLQARAGDKLDPVEQGYIERALRGAGGLAEMADALLDLGRLEAGFLPLRPVPCDITHLVREVVERLGSLADSIRIACRMPAEAVMTTCDPDAIRRVIANLLSNALHFSPEGGEVRVSLEVEGDRVRIAVSDDGPGVAPEHRRAIFEKYARIEGTPRRHRTSTGLGLAFCKLAVEAHGGAIGVESEPGRGSTFWFLLPR
ncbi:MAG: HAMP domain-containing histidine kinase [Armatimonadetes bacterium]|nr:HAMP domain-containing histidine kinase [Armatimonadota bacterium]